MHVHPPKPLHGWREFIGEVGIIVLGVLIALGFEQAVEAAHWRHKVSQAEEALGDPVALIAFEAAEQQITAPCIERQLDDLEARLTAPGAYRPVPRYDDKSGIAFVLRRPGRLWSDSVWRGIVTEGVSSHIPSARGDELHTLFEGVSQTRENARAADALDWRLNVMTLPIVDTATRAHLIEEIEELRGRSSLMTLEAGQALGYIKDLGMLPSASDARQFYSRGSGTIAFCRAHHMPMNTPHAGA